MIHDIITTRAICTPIDLLERMVRFVPRITLWEFDDTTAKSYIGKPTAPKRAMVDSVFGTPDNSGDNADLDDDDLDQMMEEL